MIVGSVDNLDNAKHIGQTTCANDVQHEANMDITVSQARQIIKEEGELPADLTNIIICRCFFYDRGYCTKTVSPKVNGDKCAEI